MGYVSTKHHSFLYHYYYFFLFNSPSCDLHLNHAPRDTEGDGEVTSGSKGGSGEAEMAVGSNPFLTPPSGSGVQYKKGYIMRKCCTDPNGKKSELTWFSVL